MTIAYADPSPLIRALEQGCGRIRRWVGTIGAPAGAVAIGED